MKPGLTGCFGGANGTQDLELGFLPLSYNLRPEHMLKTELNYRFYIEDERTGEKD